MHSNKVFSVQHHLERKIILKTHHLGFDDDISVEPAPAWFFFLLVISILAYFFHGFNQLLSRYPLSFSIIQY